MRKTTLETIKEFEGFRAKAYLDSGGTLTVGYGHTGIDVWNGRTVTKEEAEALLIRDLAVSRGQVENLDIKRLTLSQEEALTDFVFNLGIGRLRQSTLLRRIRARRTAADLHREIRGEFLRWVYSGGKVLRGLIKRRKWEAALWEEEI